MLDNLSSYVFNISCRNLRKSAIREMIFVLMKHAGARTLNVTRHEP